ncbi:MAG: hypothetical protein CMO01_23985 [Thalassobius sp.]|nr:hypothetical protein [Thalassovita sp.]
MKSHFNSLLVLSLSFLALTFSSCSKDEFEKGNELYASKKFDAAIASYTSYIDSHPKDARSYFNRARALEEQGKSEDALADYKTAAQLDTYDPSYRMGSGMCNFQLGNYNQAIIDMNEVLKINPQSAQAFYIKGVALIKNGDVQGAMESYNNALRYDKNHAAAYFQRGVLKALSKKGGACEDLQKAKALGEDKASGAIKKYCS